MTLLLILNVPGVSNYYLIIIIYYIKQFCVMATDLSQAPMKIQNNRFKNKRRFKTIVGYYEYKDGFRR